MDQGILAATLHVPDQRIYQQPSIRRTSNQSSSVASSRDIYNTDRDRQLIVGPSPTPFHPNHASSPAPHQSILMLAGNHTLQGSNQSSRRSSDNPHNPIQQQQHVHFHSQAHEFSPDELLPERTRQAPPKVPQELLAAQSQNMASQIVAVNAAAQLDQQIHMQAQMLSDDKLSDSMMSLIFIMLLFITFAINLHVALKLTYKHENFTKHVIAVATQKSLLLCQFLVVLGLVGIFCESPTILWCFSFSVLSLLIVLISGDAGEGYGELVNYANLAALGGLSAQLGYKYHVHVILGLVSEI